MTNPRMTKKRLLIPAARPVPPELQTEFGLISPCLIPLNGEPILPMLVKPYTQAGFETTIATYPAPALEAYLGHHPLPKVQLHPVPYTRTIAETVLHALAGLEDSTDYLTIHFADTMVGNDTTQGDFITYQKRADLSRWTCFAMDGGVITEISDKDADSNGFSNAFVGVFGFSQPAYFLDRLRHHSQHPTEIEPFFLALQDYTRHTPCQFVEVQRWYDFGHLDNYFQLRQNFSLGEREFNALNLSLASGVVRKHSTNIAKFVNEIAWYLKLPKKISYLAPRVLDHDIESAAPFVELEFYSYPSLNDTYLFSNFDNSVWRKIFDAIFRAHDAMGAYASENTADIPAALSSMYVEKTRTRLQEIIRTPRFAPFMAGALTINGTPCTGLPALLARLEDDAARMGVLDSPVFSIIHGDLCLSNILYDRKSNIVRLIDPRGCFGGYDIYGDPRYDLAKLCHSVLGDYDFLVHNFCRTQMDGTRITLDVFTDSRHARIKTVFLDALAQHGRYDLAQLRFIESLLFLSMVPLHNDNPDAQLAFLARGIELYTHITTHSAMRGAA